LQNIAQVAEFITNESGDWNNLESRLRDRFNLVFKKASENWHVYDGPAGTTFTLWKTRGLPSTLEIDLLLKWVEDWREEEEDLYEEIESVFQSHHSALETELGSPTFLGTWEEVGYPEGLGFEAQHLSVWHTPNLRWMLSAEDNEGQDELPWCVRLFVDPAS
jgi:hypothetical protein